MYWWTTGTRNCVSLRVQHNYMYFIDIVGPIPLLVFIVHEDTVGDVHCSLIKELWYNINQFSKIFFFAFWTPNKNGECILNTFKSTSRLRYTVTVHSISSGIDNHDNREFRVSWQEIWIINHMAKNFCQVGVNRYNHLKLYEIWRKNERCG